MWSYLIKVSEAKLIEAANLQDLDYFEKYHDILTHNLRMTMKKVKRERNRPGYEFTAQLIELTEMRRGILDCWFMELVIQTKKEMLKNAKI